MLPEKTKNGQAGFIGIESLAMIAGLLASIVLLSLNSAREKSRDAKRLGDIRQMASALELYYNDYKIYPDELKTLTPVYIGVIPTPPLPPDGPCTPEQNSYTYNRTQKDKYQLTFCLGQDTGGYAFGPKTLTEQGMRSIYPPSFNGGGF